MKCTRCHGTGKTIEWVATDTVSEYEFPCRKCNGTGEIEVTNEDWRRMCSTEDFAKFLEDVTSGCYHCGMTDDISQCAFQKHQCNIKEWLKEKHDA